MRRAALLVAFLATGTLSVPTGERSEARCAQECEAPIGSSAHVTFQPGRTHVYDYSSEVVTTLAGATDEQSRLHVTATAEVTASSGCDLTLQLREVSLQDSDPLDASSRQDVDNLATFKQELERWPLHFSYQNGRIGRLCANPGEPVWVLNFKRGVLSTFVTMPYIEPTAEAYILDEDVSGLCRAEYSVSEHGSSLLVTKRKDLLTCPGRGHLISSLQSTPYTSSSSEHAQSLPLIKSSLQCEQKVSEDRLLSVECRESHLFEPFSHGENGAVTRSTVRLTERTVRSAGSWWAWGGDEDMPTTKTRITFDHTDAELTQQNRVPAAAELLSQLEEKTSDNVRPDVPRLFTRLVTMLRHFNEDGLLQLDAQLEAGSAAKRYFVDALPLAGSAPALALMREMILRGRVTDETTDRWMTSLAFVHEPSVAMVAAVAPLLEVRDARRQTLLGVSSLVHHYCKLNVRCTAEAPVRAVIGQLERALGPGCRAASEEEELKMLTALKALGNAGRLVDPVSRLRSCFEDDDNSMEVRLAAVRAFRRMPCETVSESGLMSAFADPRGDTEVRIAAYLAVMQCPTHEIVDKVQEVLSAEPVNQVSSFVWSHLTNMQETNDPTKSYMKSVLYNVNLSDKFNTDMRKFSRYFEKTMFSESMNAGATVDANVIFTPDSYMPKSGMFNLTVDLFGEAFNLLEVGGRVEGLEDFSESLFGSNGIYPQETISQILKTMRTGQSNALSSGRIQSPKASAYMKIFGNELQFGKYDSLKELVASMGAKNPLDFLQKLAKDMDWTENYQFLDSSYTLPTIAGFPFKLKVTGSATLSLKTGGSFDVQSWSMVNIDGFIKPSAAVEIMSEMLVDAHVAHTGLKMNTNLHTSTILDGHAIVDGGKLVSVRVNMPRDKIEILDVNTRFHSVFRNKARKLQMYADNRYELKSCSDKYISTDLLGVNLCADVSYSRGTSDLPSCLLSGPLTARFTVEKTDDFKAFEFEYRHSNEEGIRKSSFVIDTVGSVNDRRISADYAVDFKSSEFKAGFHTPIKSMDVSGTLNLAGRTKRADFSLKMDDRELFGVTSSFVIDDTAVTVRYSPSLSVRGPEGELGNFQGSLIANKNKHKYTVDLTITKVFQTPVVFKGSLNEVDGTYTVATSMESFLLDGNMKGTFRVAGDNLLIQTHTTYTFLDGQPQTIGINSKLSNYENDGEKTYRLFVDTKFSALPMLDCQLTVERRATSDRCQTSATLTRGDRSYELTSELEYAKKKVGGTIGFAARHWNVDFKLGGTADFSKDNKVVVTTDAQLNEEYFAKTKVGVDYKNEDNGFHYGVKAELALPSSTYTINTGVRKEEQNGHLRVVARHETGQRANEVALVGALNFGGDELGGELTFRMPHYPSYELSARLVPGTDGLYLARVVAEAGPETYVLGGELKLDRTPMELDLVFEAPTSGRKSAHLTAVVAGPRPRVTVDLRFSRRITAVLEGNFYPSENTGNFEIFWNKDVDDTDKASVEVLLREMDMSAILKYPGRQIKLVGELNADGWTSDLQYAPGKVIHAEGNIPSDARFLRVDVTTPIEGFTTMSLTYREKSDVAHVADLLDFEVIGRLEDQEARMLGHFVVEDFIEARLELFTPLAGWEKSLLSFRYLMNNRSFEARVTAAKNDEEVALGGSFEILLEDVFKIHASLDLALPTDSLRKGKVGFDLKFAENRLDSGALVHWKTIADHELSLTLTSQHSVDHEIHIDSTVTLHTPFEGYETMSSHLKLDKRTEHLSSMLNFKHAGIKVLNTELVFSGGYVSRHGRFSFTCAKCSSFNAEFDFNVQNELATTSFSSNFGDKVSVTLNLRNGVDETVGDVADFSLQLVLPTDPSRYTFKQSRVINTETRTGSEHLELTWGSKKIASDMNLKWNIKQKSDSSLEAITMTGNGKLTTPFLGWESMTVSHNMKMTLMSSQPSYSGYTKYVNSEGKTIEVTDKMNFEDKLNWQLQRAIVSESKWVSSATHEIRSRGNPRSVQLTLNSEKAGQTAQLEYSHDISDIQLSASLGGRWYGGATRSLKVAVRNAAEAIYPALDVTYDEGKTMRIYGSITKNRENGQSTATLEAPFTDRAVLSVSHDLDKKKLVVEYLHGEKRYTIEAGLTINYHLVLDAELLVKFSSPRSCWGDASFLLAYEAKREFKIKGKLTHNDWEVSMNSRIGFDKKHITINTPYSGYTQLSANYQSTENGYELRLNRETVQILMVISRTSSSDALTYNMRVNTPYSGYETMTLTINQPLGLNRINAEYQRGRQTAISANIKYDFSGPIFWVSAEAESTLEGFSTVAMHTSYNMFNQEAKLVLSKENKKLETKVVAGLSPLYSELSVEYFNNLVDFGLPEQLTVTGMYNIRDVVNSMELAVVKGQEKFLINAEAQLSGLDKTFITVSIATPFDGYESAKFDARLVSAYRVVLAKLEVSKNDDIFKAIFEGKEEDFKLTGSVALHTPFENYRLTRLTAEYGDLAVSQWDGFYAKLIAERNSDQYVIKASAEDTDNDGILFTLTTPFTDFERLSLEGSSVYTEDGMSVQCIFTRNADQIRVALTTEVSWTKSMISLEVTSPFVEARSLGATAMYDIRNERKTCQLILNVNDKQYGMSGFVTMKTGAAIGLIELDTPIHDWEHLKYQVTYDVNRSEKVVEVTYERNGVKKVIASRGSYDGETAYIDVITPLEGYESMGLSGRYVNSRGKREAGYDAHVNGHRHRLHIQYERQGMESAVLKIETPIEGMHLIELNARSQVFPDGIGFYINTNRDGKRNSIDIRTVKDDNSIGVDIGVKSYIQGLESVRLSGNIVTRGRKRSFSLRSVRGSNEAEISGELVMKRRSGNGKLKVALPIGEWGDVDASFDYKLGPTKSFRLTSTRGGVTREYSGSLQYTDSSATVTLNTPFNGFETLSADASRNEGPDGTISAKIKLARGSRKIEITYDYNFSGSEGSANVKATTPYDGFRTLQTSLRYYNGPNSRSLEFRAGRDDRQWHLQTSRNWERGADSGSLLLETPLDEIKQLKFSRAFNVQNLAALTYEAAYERNGRKFSLSGNGSIKRKGKKSSFDVTITTPLAIGELGARVSYDFAGKPNTIDAKLNAGERHATLSASLGPNEGSIGLVTTNELLPQADITYTADVSPKKREVQAALTLYDGRKVELDYLADYRKKNKANGHVFVKSTTYGDRKLTWNYAVPKDDFSGDLNYVSPNGNLELSVSVDGKQFVQRKIVIKSSIESPVYTSTLTANLRYNTKNGFNTRNKVVYNGKTYSLTFDAKKVGGKREVSITYDGQLLKGVKIDGSWTLPENTTPQKEFDIKYKRGSRAASLKGRIQVPPGGKAGSVDLEVETPFEEVQSLTLKTSWDFVLPNRILKVDYNRNGRRPFSLNLYGTKQEENGKLYGQYSLTLTTPPTEIAPGIRVHEYSWEVAFDRRQGRMVKLAMTSPIEEELKVDIKESGNVRTIDANYRYNDEIGLTPYMIPFIEYPSNIQIDFSSKRTNRRAGPKIDLLLNTNFAGFEEIEAHIDIKRGGAKSTLNANYRRGNRYAELTAEIERSASGSTINFDLSTPLEGFEQVHLSGSFTREPTYGLTLDYSRGDKFVKISSSAQLDIQRSYGQLQSGSIDARFKLDSYITKRTDLLMTLEGSMEAQPRRSLRYKYVSTLNGKTLSINHEVSRAEAGRRTGRIVIQTPFKYPFKKIVYNGDVSLASNKAVFSLEYGRKKVELDVSWFAGEANQYGAEIRLTTPYKMIQAVELDAKVTVQPRSDVADVLVHYRRGEKMVHVTGTVRPVAVDLHFETPTFGNFGVKGGFTREAQGTIKVEGLVSLPSGKSAGVSVAVKPEFRANNAQITIDIHTPVEGFERLNIDLAYTNLENSNVLRVAFESPMTKRVELAVELTNLTDNYSTNFRAGVTTNYLGKAFTFKTSILRDREGMKYELEIESPFHILPSFKITGRR